MVFLPPTPPPGIPRERISLFYEPTHPLRAASSRERSKKERSTIPNLMGAQKPLNINPIQLKMEKLVSSKNVNLSANIQWKVNFSLKTK